MQTKTGEYFMKRFIAGVIFIGCVAALVGCETVKGAGRDIEDTGHNIQKTANR
jgi:predicted small secreted protein